IKDLKIYTAKFQNGGWVNTDPFPFNSDEYDNCHPALSADGNVLVFASDMPDGEGGMDLYVCFKRDNVWTKPINLGKQINTSGNEIFPFLDVKGTLYFSSNGLKGMGGLDIFSATKNGNEFFWTSPVNLGQPFNSIRDDLSYTGARSGQEGYFASNREGGLGEDDIYHWVLKPEYKGLSENLEGLIPISVVDKESALPIADAKVNLFNEKSESFAFLTNAEGKIGKEVTRKETKFIECEKDGYKPNHKFLTQEMVGNPSKSIIFLEPETYQPMRGNVVDRSTDQPIQDAEILITNLSTGEVRSLRSKSDGSYSTTLLCANDYKFSVTKPDYLKNEDDFHKNEILCRSDKSIIKDFHLTPYKINDKRKQLSAALLGNESEKFEAGRSFEVKDIYYDYNKFAIRKDAAKVLDKLVDLLKEFPEMEIELSSHTDSRGRDSYNQKLSQQRADSAVKYLIQKGIQASRLRAAGYGESLLKNNCEDGVNCSEDEHQINRRTEIKILKL
ncbi:MAG: OmpA family protein, partial [Saprospiraceae bacterium]|nr:OmpA family protein [Saprospiraceae bacterium]